MFMHNVIMANKESITHMFQMDGYMTGQKIMSFKKMMDDIMYFCSHIIQKLILLFGSTPIAGILLGVYLSRAIPQSHSLLFFLRVSMAILVGTLVFHTALEKIGIPLSW